MSSTNDDPQIAAIKSILLEAQQAGVGKLTRTSLIKFLYLLDLFTAEESAGKTWTGAEWRFLHFGPFAGTLADQIDYLASKSFIEQSAGGGTDKEYFLYSLGEWNSARPLREIGVSANVAFRIAAAIREYAGNLNKLLEWVYFHTLPMQSARPGEKLSFDEVRKVDFKADVKPIRVPTTDKAKIRRLKELVASIGTTWRVSGGDPFDGYTAPLYDEHYKNVVCDPDYPEIQGQYSARLVFEGDS